MKKSIRSIILGTGLFFMTFGTGYSQLGDIGDILRGIVDDNKKNAEIILTEYLRPLGNSLGANLNGGWYNTAKVHGTAGFHLTITASAAFAPEAARIYNLSEMGLVDLDLVQLDNPNAPTFSGEEAPPTLTFPRLGVNYLEFDHPPGTGQHIVPSPMINAGFGLPKGFEILGRYMPRLNYNDLGLGFGLWGLGAKHDIGQWIPFIKKVPALHLSLMYGYTKVHADAKLKSITPDDLSSPELIIDDRSSIDWDNNEQKLDLGIQGHTANLLVGANFPVVALYGGVGVSITKTNLAMLGYYPIPTLDLANGNLVITDESAEKDPINIEIKNSDGSTTKPRLNAGIRFKFSVVTIHADYTWANYSVLTAGLGISFR